MTHEEFIDQYLQNVIWHMRDNVLHIKQSVCLMDSDITSLPDNLHIHDSLDVRKTKITSLPNNLYIYGWLDIRKTKIKTLPEDLDISNFIFVDAGLELSEKTQLNLISKFYLHFHIIKNPTKKAEALHKLLWRI